MISREDGHLTVTMEMLERYTWESELTYALVKLDMCLWVYNQEPADFALVRVDRFKRLVHVYPRYDRFYANCNLDAYSIRNEVARQMDYVRSNYG